MLAYPGKKLLFVHIHKNAGKAVKAALKRLIWRQYKELPYIREWKGQPLNGHISLPELISRFPEFGDYYAFATIRNPWDRLASAYFWIRSKPEGSSGGFNRSHLEWAPTFEIFVDGLWHSFKSFGDERENPFVTKPSIRLHEAPYVYPSQVSYLYDDAGMIGPQRVCRQERLFEDLRQVVVDVFGKKGLDFLELRVNGPSNKPDYRDLYTSEMVERVARMYAVDIERFGYTF